MPHRRRSRGPSKLFTADGRSRARVRAARRNLKVGNKRFRTIEAKMRYLRSLRGR